MYPKMTLLIMALAAAGCSPLKQVQTERHEALAISDTTLTTLIRREIEHHFGTLRQTVVEFYPPAERPKPCDGQLPDPPDTLLAMLSPQKIPTTNAVRQPVKRIIYTEATLQSDKATLADSISRSRINTAARNDTRIVTEEKPSSGVAWLRWAAALAGFVLLIILFLKLR